MREKRNHQAIKGQTSPDPDKKRPMFAILMWRLSVEARKIMAIEYFIPSSFDALTAPYFQMTFVYWFCGVKHFVYTCALMRIIQYFTQQ